MCRFGWIVLCRRCVLAFVMVLLLSGEVFAQERKALGVHHQSFGCLTGVVTGIATPILATPSLVVMVGEAVTFRKTSLGWGAAGASVGGIHLILQVIVMGIEGSSCRLRTEPAVVNILAMALHTVTLALGIVHLVRLNSRGGQLPAWRERDSFYRKMGVKVPLKKPVQKKEDGDVHWKASKPPPVRKVATTPACVLVFRLYRSLLEDRKNALQARRAEGALRKLEKLNPKCFATPEGAKWKQRWKRTPVRGRSGVLPPSLSTPHGAKVLLRAG